jgi:hypothetical protein
MITSGFDYEHIYGIYTPNLPLPIEAAKYDLGTRQNAHNIM